MRAYRLASVAAEAEAIRWQCMASRMAMRVLFAVIAVLFLIGVIAFAHIAAWYWLRTGFDQGFYAAACILGGTDLFVAVVFGFLASRSSPGREEREALAVRRRALQNIATALSITEMAIPVLRMTNNLLRRSRA
jgi:hypothetical protein